MGLVLSTTDPINNKITYGYDDFYRLTSETDEENRTTTYGYDPVGNLLSLTDPEQNTTSYTYDNIDWLITDTNQLGDTRTYGYDPASNRVSSIDRNGREINYTYDNLNRNTAEIWLDEAGNSLRTFNYEYDAASQLTSAVDPDSSYSYEYDLDGRITSVDNAGTIGVPNVVFNYSYDPVDNLTQVSDSINGVDAGVETFAYDLLDRVTSITQSGDGVIDKRVDIGYDAASQVTDLTRYSDLAGTEETATTNYIFDNASRLTNLTHNQAENVLSAYEWVYDDANRITQATTPDGVSNFNYDGSDQLLDANYDFQDDENYVYDENGNRVNDGYVTGENNRLLSDGTYNYEYDGEGNRISRTEIATGEVTEYEWDHRNRLVGVATRDSEGLSSDGENVIANSEYAYDVYDRRILKSVDADGDGAGEAVVERYVHDGEHIALTFDGEGNQTERFLHGTNIDQVLAQENAGGEVLWALGDHQGSVRMLLDNDGNVVNNIIYDAFGNITVESNPEVNFRFSYTGREFDEETGQYYYRTRYYDPAVGQFINEDTIGFDGGDANLYRYVANSPLNYTDPNGQVAIAGVLLVTAAVVIAADLLSPDGANAPTNPTEHEGNKLEAEDPRLNPNACNSEPINFDQPKDLDRSLQRAGIEIILSAGLSNASKAPSLLKSLAGSSDEISTTLSKNLKNLLPKDFGDVPVLVDGFFDDAVKQADEAFETFGQRGLDRLRQKAPGLGAAADDLFKPFFEARREIISDGSKTDARSLLRDSKFNDLSNPQKRKILKKLSGGRADSVSIKVDDKLNARLTLERAGRDNGFQRFSHKIAPDGSITRTVQTAFDDSDNLVRQKPGASKNNLFDVKRKER